MAFEYTTEPETIVTIYDDEALQAMQGWWAGQGDPLYAIYSNGGEAPVHVIEHAISNLESDIARVKKLGRDQFKLGQGTFTKAEIGELYAIRDALVGALENRGEIQERRPTVPAFQRPGVRVRYAYTDGPVRAGTLGTIEGWLPTPYKAQIRWNNGTMSSHTPDEYEVIRRTATEESHGEALELEAGTGSDKARWDTLRAQFLAADEAARAQEIAMRVKWGDAGWRNWASRGERTKLDKLLERRDKIGNKLFELLLRVSPRGEAWRTGAPAFWIHRDLTWEDAIRPANEPLSVVVPAPYGASHGITEHGMHEHRMEGGTNFHVNFQTGERLRIRVKGPQGQPMEAFWYTVEPGPMTLNEIALRFAQTAQTGMLLEIVSGKLKWTFRVEQHAGQTAVTRVRGDYMR